MMNRAGWLFCAVVLFAQSVHAHPFPTEQLGRFSELVIHRDRVDVKYTLSLTRLLLIEEIVAMNTDGDSKISDEEKKVYYSSLRETLREGMSLRVDGRPVRLDVTRGIEVDPPVDRVFHLRGSFDLLGAGKHRIVFEDQNYPKLPGPVEIVAKASDEIALLSKVNVDLSKTYQAPETGDEPMDAFQIRELEILFHVGDAGVAPAQEGPEAGGKGDTGATVKRQKTRRPAAKPVSSVSEKISGLADKVFRGEIVGVRGTVVVLCTFVLLGATHALTPGHGKTIVAAYLIGSKGRIRDAVFLGAVVTFTHTASVVILGVIVHVLKNVFLPAKLNPFIASASGVLILVMGVCLIVSRARGKGIHTHSHGPDDGHGDTHEHDHHDHEHGSDHGHDHDHDDHDHDHEHDHEHTGHSHGEHGTHEHGSEVTMAALLSLGIAGGVVPCPDALAVLLLAISFNHLLLGLFLLLAFSLGLAAVLIAIGVLLVTGRMKLPKGARESKVVGIYLPVASAIAITILGAAMTVVPLARAGILTIRLHLPG